MFGPIGTLSWIGGTAVAVSVLVMVSIVPSDPPLADLVVIDPPSEFEQTASRLGFTVGKNLSLKGLDMAAIRVSAPSGETDASAIALLRVEFPDLTVEKNSFGDF